MFSGEKQEHHECIIHIETAQCFDGEDEFNDTKGGRLAD